MISNLVSQISQPVGNPKNWLNKFQAKPVASTQPNQSTVQGAIGPAFPTKTQPTVAAPKPTAGAVRPVAQAPQQQMTTPSGLQVTGNPATYAGITPQPSSTSRGLFSDVASSLAKPQVNQMTQESYARAQKLAEDLKTSRMNQATGEAQQRLAPIPIGDATGRQAVLRQQYEEQQSALSGQLQAESALAGLGIQQQGLEQSALGTVAGLAPEATRFETFGGGSLSPQTRATELAQQVRSGFISPQAAEQQMNSLYGGAGATFLNQALQGGGFNYNTATAQAASQQSNVQQAGTAQVDIARQGLQQATQDYVNMTGAAQFADQQAGAVEQILAKAGLNNVSSTDYTKVLNNLKSRFGDTNFAALNTALIEARSAYANLLSTSGQTPSGNEEQAIKTLDINQSAAAIRTSIQQLESAVARRLQAQNSVRLQYEQNLGGGQSSTGGAPTGAITWDNIGD